MADLSDIPDDMLRKMIHDNLGTVVDAVSTTKNLVTNPLSIPENFSNAAMGTLGKAATSAYGIGADIGEKTGYLTPEEAQRRRENAYTAQREIIPEKYPTHPGMERMAGEMAPWLPFGAFGSPIVSGAVSGGLNSLAETDPRKPVSEKLTNAGIGITLGGVTGKAIGTLLGPSKNTLTSEQQKYIETLKQNNIPVTPAQETGNAAYNRFEGLFNKFPITSGIQANAEANQAKAFSNAVLDKAGLAPSTDIQTVVGKGYKNSGGMIGQITQNYQMPIDNAFTQDVLNVSNKYHGTMQPAERPQFKELVDQITDPAKASLSGTDYQTMRSKLGDIANAAWKRDPIFARAVDDLQRAMDDSIVKTMHPDDVTALMEARKNYSGTKDIMRAMKSGSEEALSGNIMPQRLGSVMRQKYGDNYGISSNPMLDLSKAGEATIRPPRTPDTMGKSLGKMLFGSLPVDMGIGASIMGASNPAALAIGATTAGTPIALQQAYNRIPQYFVNGVPYIGTKPAMNLGAMLTAEQMSKGAANRE